MIEGRRQRQLDTHFRSIVRLRPLQDGSTFERLILSAAHQFSAHNSARSELSIWGLQVFISNFSRKLNLVVKSCSACALYRAVEGRKDNLIQSGSLGSAEYLLRTNLWLSCKKLVLCDLAGPLTCDNTTIFALLFLELPLKTLQILPLKNYSCSALYLALLTYSQKNLERCQILISDNGSQLSPFHNGVLGYQTTLHQEADDPLNAWFKLSLSTYGEQLQKNGIFLKVLSKNHKSLAAVEMCVSALKRVFYEYNLNLQSELDIFQWQYLFALTSKSVATRPICRGSKGEFFTPQKILQLLNQAGSMDTKPEFPPPIARTDELQIKLEQAGEKLLSLRSELSYYLLSATILPAIQDEEVRTQRTRRRGNDLQLTVGCISSQVGLRADGSGRKRSPG